MPQNLTNEKSALVQVMAWWCQAASHYLSQCWPRSMWPYGITKPQWVHTIIPDLWIQWQMQPCICRVTQAHSSTHYNDVIMSVMVSQITSLMIVCSGTDQRKHHSSALQAFVRGIHWWPVNSPHKGPVTRTMFPFDDIIMMVVVVYQLCIHRWAILTEWSLPPIKSHFNIKTIFPDIRINIIKIRQPWNYLF